MDEELIDPIEESIQDLPEEARDFIFGNDLKITKEVLLQNITDEQERTRLSNMIMAFLVGEKTEKELSDCIDGLTIDNDKKALLKNDIQEKIINELLLLIEVHEEMDAEDGVTDTITNPPTSLTSLSDRLKQTSISTPVTRDYSANSPRPIDPYHESIDNE